jgi:multiple sugar transport system substrate-binding protein
VQKASPSRSIRAAISSAAALLLCACGQGVHLELVDQDALLPALSEVAQAYEQSHAGVAVSVAAHGGMRSLFRFGRAPDLVLIDYRRLAALAADGAIAPLDPGADLAGMAAPALAAFQLAGRQQCAPLTAGSLVIYYNRKLFERFGVALPKDGWTSHDFFQAALKLSRQDLDGDGKPDSFGFGFQPSLAHFAPFLWSVGQDLVDDPVAPTHLAIDRPDALRALSWVKQLKDRYGVVPPESAHESRSERWRFLHGEIGMLLEDRGFTADLRGSDLDWDVATFPRLGRPASTLDSLGLCLSADARQRADALAFLAFATGAQGQALLARSGLVVPARTSVAASADFLDPSRPPASAHVFIDQLAYARTLPHIASWPEIERVADPVVEEWYYESEAGGASEEEEEGGGPAAELAMELRDRVNPLLLDSVRPRAR